MLSLIPVVLANYPSIQVVTLATVMLLGMMVQMRSWPWKTKARSHPLAPCLYGFLLQNRSVDIVLTDFNGFIHYVYLLITYNFNIIQ